LPKIATPPSRKELQELYDAERVLRLRYEADAAREAHRARDTKRLLEHERSLVRKLETKVETLEQGRADDHQACNNYSLSLRSAQREIESLRARLRGIPSSDGAGGAPGPPPPQDPPASVPLHPSMVALGPDAAMCTACGLVNGHTNECPLGGRGASLDERVTFSFDGLFGKGAGFGPEDLKGSVAALRDAPVRTFDPGLHPVPPQCADPQEKDGESQDSKAADVDAEPSVGPDRVCSDGDRGDGVAQMLERLNELVNAAAGSTDPQLRSLFDLFASAAAIDPKASVAAIPYLLPLGSPRRSCEHCVQWEERPGLSLLQQRWCTTVGRHVKPQDVCREFEARRAPGAAGRIANQAPVPAAPEPPGFVMPSVGDLREEPQDSSPVLTSTETRLRWLPEPLTLKRPMNVEVELLCNGLVVAAWPLLPDVVGRGGTEASALTSLADQLASRALALVQSKRSPKGLSASEDQSWERLTRTVDITGLLTSEELGGRNSV